MKVLVLATVALLLALPASAAGPVVSTPIDKTTATWTGQPIALPQGPVQVVSQIIEIPVGGSLAVHKHPYPRFAYVLSGRLKVTNDDAGKTLMFEPGAYVVEAVGQWHHAEVVGDAPVRLVVMDEVPPGASNVVMKTP